MSGGIDADSIAQQGQVFSLSFGEPIHIQVPASVSNGKTLDELKFWIWQEHAQQIFRSLQLTTTTTLSATDADKTKQKNCEILNTTADTNDVSTLGDNGNRDTNTTTNDLKEEEIEDAGIPPSSKKRQYPLVGPGGVTQKNRENLLDTIAKVQRQFFQSVAPREIFGGLLEGLLDLMSSEYGFIGEIKYENDDEEEGKMFLQTHAITNIAWNQATRQFYEDNHESGLKFYNLNTLFGTVMTTQQPVISNNPLSDPRAGGIPEGHPPLNHFLGLPFFHSGKLTGMVGISNKPGGYTEADIEFLEPLTVTCSNLIQAFQQIKRNEYLINTLEESVKARTQELETVNKNLEEANRQVRQNAVMQMQHFACMSHEIRTPLNCIIGMSTLLHDTKLSPMQEESLKMILASGDLLLAIVNDVLDYAKLETDHVELNIMRSDLQDMLQSILYSIQIKAKGRGQSIKSIYDPYLPVFVNTDIRRIQQIMFNLLGNAVKFSRDYGTVELEVSYQPAHSTDNEVIISRPSYFQLEEAKLQKDLSSERTACEKEDNRVSSRCPFHKSNPDLEIGTKVHPASKLGFNDVPPVPHVHTGLFDRQHYNLRFVVTDYGKGINRSDFEAIFRPFQQASGTEMDTVYGGTGLGLAITKKLVTALGGTITVDSEEGSWSKFIVELPCSDPPAPVEELSRKMSDATVIFAGLPKCQETNVLRIFHAFSVDTRLVDSMESFRDLLSPDSSNAIASHRRIMCLVHGDILSLQWSRLASEYFQQRNEKLFLFTFGSHPSSDAQVAIDRIHHIRSLEQEIPQSLIETLHEKSSISRTEIPTSVAKSMTLTRIEDSMHSNLRILIAEDNQVNQKVLLRMLRRLGVEFVDVVDNGRDAVDKEESTAYDLILMDQQMPIMGGVQACRLIVGRSHRTHPVPLIFFVTAHVSPNFERECREAGCTGFLPKPFKFDDIGKCLQDAVKMTMERGQ